jgi:hypothetical protein
MESAISTVEFHEPDAIPPHRHTLIHATAPKTKKRAKVTDEKSVI